MYHFTPKCKRPKLTLVPPPGTHVLVHDDTYASYKHAIAWAQKTPGGLRLCTNPHRFEVITPEWIESTKQWMRDKLVSIHERRDLATGITPIRELMMTESGRTEDEILAIASVRFGVPTEDLRLPGPAYDARLPMGLIDGPVPFRPSDVAAFALSIIRCRPIPLVEPPSFRHLGGSRWLATCELDAEGRIIQLPYGTTPRDFPELRDVGSYAEPLFIGPPVSREVEWRVVLGTGDEVVVTDPIEYVKMWIRARISKLEQEAFEHAEYMKKRNQFVRTVWVNKKFTTEFHDPKREYLDETREQKRRRIASVFGSKYVDAFMKLPIGDFGPDFEEDDDEDEDISESEMYDTDREDEVEEPRPKRRRTGASVMDTLIQDLERILRNNKT